VTGWAGEFAYPRVRLTVSIMSKSVIRGWLQTTPVCVEIAGMKLACELLDQMNRYWREMVQLDLPVAMRG